MRHEERTSAGSGRRSSRSRPGTMRRMLLAGVGLILLVIVALSLLPSNDDPTTPAAEPVEVLALPDLIAPVGREIFVTPDGQATSPGTREAPVDLATALSSNTPASPGDVIWLREGTYEGNFTSVLIGSESAPIHVRQYPGERATIAAIELDQPALTADGAWTWFRDFEITAAASTRSPTAAAPGVEVRQGGGVVVKGARIGLLNLVVHDLPKGIEVVPGAERVVLAGNLIYYSWWPDPPLGVGIRVAPGSVTQYIVDNIVFGQGAAGISVGMTPAGRLLLEGNVSFNNGLNGDFYDRNLLVEGGGLLVKSNYTYYEPKRGGGENNFGYSSGCESIEMVDNYFAHRAYPFTLSKCTGRLNGNVFIGPVDPSVVSRYPDNTYERSAPSGLRAFARARAFDLRRSHVVVFNWDRHAAVNVALSGANLPPGTAYEVRDAQNYFGGRIAVGTYEGGRINLPATGLAIAKPAGGKVGADIAHTGPEFLVLILEQTSRDDTRAGTANSSTASLDR